MKCVGRGQGQGQLLFKLHEQADSERSLQEQLGWGALAGWRLLLPPPLVKGGFTRVALGMPKTSLLSPTLGLQPPRVGSPSFANGMGHP